MFQGLDGFKWFTGVVEDRKDPAKRGRVRVRIHALHSKEKQVNDKTGQGIPTEDLPWAIVMRPATSASMDGIGQTPLGLVEGSWVWGFSRDGDAFNDLIIVGSIGGKPEDPPRDNNGKEGFVDPRTEEEIANSPRYINKIENRDPSYPGQGIPQGRYPQEKWLNEVDVNRLARGEKLEETLLKPKRENLVKRINTAFDSLWEEKSSPYGAQYPFNHVFESESGHVMEFDDTKDAERWHLWHKSKSYMEFGPNGDFQFKSTGDLFSVAQGNLNTFSKQNVNLTAAKSFGIRSDTADIKLKAAKGSVRVDAAEEIYMVARGQNSFHMISEKGAMTLTTEKSSIAMTAMTGITQVATTGNVSTVAPVGQIQGVASLGVSYTALAGNASFSSLGGNVSVNAAAGLADVTGLMGAAVSSLNGSLGLTAGKAINLLAKAQEISFISQIGTISAIANAGLSLVNQLTGSISIESFSTNPFDSVSLSSLTQLDISTTLGSLSVSTENPFGTGIVSPRSLELRSLEDNVFMSSAAGSVGVSAFTEISLSAPTVTLDSPSLELLSDSLLLDANDITIQTSTLLSLSSGTDLDIQSAGVLSAFSADDFNLESVANFSLISGSNLDISSTDSIEISSGSTLDLISITGLSLLSNDTLDITSTGAMNIAGSQVTIDGQTGTVLIQTGSSTITMTDTSITIDSPTVLINGSPTFPGLDGYGSYLKSYFDTIYAPI